MTKGKVVEVPLELLKEIREYAWRYFDDSDVDVHLTMFEIDALIREVEDDQE